jgi:ribonucleoside-diphosphate reductase alpha chain
MLGIRYDSDAGRRLAADVTTTLRDAAYGASATLARERGPFPRFHRARYLESAFVRRLPRTLRLDIGAAGMRNSHLMAIAPTGSIALLADNVSSGIEPIFRAHYQRRVPCGAFATRRVSVDDFACQRWRAGGRSGTPPALVTARELSAEDHLAMQAAVQPLVDQGISKTVNVPQQTEITTISGLYRRAFELGLKGITVFRPAARQRGPLRAVREPAAPCGAALAVGARYPSASRSARRAARSSAAGRCLATRSSSRQASATSARRSSSTRHRSRSRSSSRGISPYATDRAAS